MEQDSAQLCATKVNMAGWKKILKASKCTELHKLPTAGLVLVVAPFRKRDMCRASYKPTCTMLAVAALRS